MKVSKRKIKEIIADRKAGLMVGELKWKYDLTVQQIMRILDDNQQK